MLLADEMRSMLLDWPKRFHITDGIARGLFGYMSPEYAVYGLFSVKSDVFSFEDRPSMSFVVLMLGSAGGLPSPKHYKEYSC
ncbi:hypothetical protein RJ640_029555 [Escallonia rubra]|uniref:Uncharacterized protein n=1 Tax=Escallonia rubra TaxID=112253 RepID=A0AA88RIM6_9ASTE|nr:hypothetical protein RJ640_029555 [Escallonia rubra]